VLAERVQAERDAEFENAFEAKFNGPDIAPMQTRSGAPRCDSNNQNEPL